MKIKIAAIKNEDKISNNGKSYTRCSIKVIDKNGQDLWISGFGNNTTKSWVKGQEVELEVYKEEYQGKEYWKFQEVEERNIFIEIDKINSKLDWLISQKNQENQNKQPQLTVKEVEEAFAEKDKIPF